MKLPIKPRTLFGRTAWTFSIAFLIFSLFSLGMVSYFVAMPLTQRAADDLSALIVLTTQIWVELPPGTRNDFEREMLKRHTIVVSTAGDPLPPDDSSQTYLGYIETSLQNRTKNPQRVTIDNAQPDWRWVDVSMGGRKLRVGFLKERLISRIPLTMIMMVLAGTLIAVLTSLFMVRRITSPLSGLAEATKRIGEGKRGEPLAETGPEELHKLARNFNQMERQLEVLMKNRTTLLAGISHDLRTPIARMQLELELLEGDPDPELVDGMRQNLDEMNGLITTTLQLSRGLGDQVLEVVDLSLLLPEIVQQFNQRGASISLECENACQCRLSLSAFRRVLHNLIENAIRYSENEPIDLSCSCNQKQMLIQVNDQGPGIPAELREQVFQPFKRLEDSRNRSSGGSGLGLAIVDQLCSANDWTIELGESAKGGLAAVLKLPCDSLS